MSEWKKAALVELVDIRVSNVDKKIYPSKKLVLLCNYMDVYSNKYITNKINFSIGSADLNEINRFTLLDGDVVITKDSETPDDIAVPSVVIDNIPNLVCGYHLAILRPRKDKISGRYLMHKMNLPEVQKYFFRVASGSTRYGLTIGGIEKTEITLPPLPHQRKIARILTTVDNIIEKTEAAIAKYKAIKQGMMHDLFTRGIDVKTGKLRPKFEDAPELYKESELGWIPKEWEVDKLGTLVETYAGGTPSRSRPEYFGGDIPWVSSSEVNQPEICKTKENITREGFENSSVKWVKEGSILIAMYGATAGKISKLRINATTNQAVLACIDSKDLKSGFIFHLANCLMDKILFKVQGSGQPNLSKDIIDTTPIFKISIAEQILITDRLNTIDRLIANEKKSVDKLKQQKTGLMQDLLTGKKEVAPDPEDYANDGEPV